jgi:hypothetical protein
MANISAARQGRPIEILPSRSLPPEILSSLQNLDSWIEGERYRGWDPHDALNSPLLRGLALKNRLAGIFWVQLLKRSPLNLRTLLAIPKGYNAKGMGLFLASYVRKYAMACDPDDKERIVFFSRWLLESVSQGHAGMSWGYNFDWPNRSSFAPAGTPTVVNTAFIALAFLDAHLLLGKELPWSRVIEGHEGSHQALRVYPALNTPMDVARSACDFVLRDLNVLAPNADELCFSYTPLDHRFVHNASMMGAWLLAAVFRQSGERHLREAALAAARFTARRQLPNGSWVYGEKLRERWVDNFHTGFVLVALKRVSECLGTDEFDHCLHRGYRFWKEKMFLPDGAPKYYANRIFPIDVHSVAQAILTFLEFRQADENADEHAIRVAGWGIDNLQDRSGYYYYQVHRMYKIRIPYMRWAQAWMQRALTELTYSYQ